MKKIGIFGGRFDPVHIGHLILAQDVLEKLSLDKIVFLVSHNPPHKGNFASFEDRYEMVKLAVENNPCFEASDFEKRINLEKNYTVEVLKEFVKGKNDQFYFIMGADQFTSLDSWYKPEELVKLVKLVVLKRPGFELKNNRFSKYVTFVDERLVEISSTEIRERVKKGLSLRYLLPSRVIEYIRKKGLYR